MSLARFERLKDKLLAAGRPSLQPRALLEGSEARSIYARLQPFAEAMFLVVAADDEVEESERDVVRGALRVLTGGELGTAAMEAMLGEFEMSRARDGLEVRLDDIASA